MKVIASSPSSVRADGPDASRRGATRAVWGSAIAILAVAVAVASSRDDAEGLRPPAAEQAVAGVPGFDRPGAASMGAEVASDRIRIDSAGAAASAVSPTAVLCGLNGGVRTSDGQVVPNSPVFLVARGHAGRQCTITGPDGRFEFAAGAGRHTLVVPPFACLPGVEQEIELRPEVTRVEIALPRLATAQIDGRIVDTEGLPLSGTRAVLRTASAPAAAAFVETDRGGYFQADVPAGDLVLRTSEPIRAEVRGHELTAGTSSLQFVLDIGCHRVAGQAVAEGGTPAAGAHVQLNRCFTTQDGIRCVSTRTLVTDQNGNFAFERLGPGPGSLTVMASGCATEVVDVAVDSSAVVVVHRIAN